MKGGDEAATVVSLKDGKAEDSLLASLLAWPKSIGTAMETGLKKQHFAHEKLGVAYAAAERVLLDGGQVEPVTVYAALESVGHVKPKHPEGWERAELETLRDIAAAPGNVRTYAERIMEKAERRHKRKAGEEMIAASELADVKEFRQGVQDALEEASVDYEIEAEPTSPEEIAGFFHDFLEEPDPPTVFPLPWAGLNDGLPGGLVPGNTSAWIGWTNHGKSVAVDESMSQWHKEGFKCAVIGTEMSLAERMSRHLMRETGISSLRILKRDLSNEEKHLLAKCSMPDKIPFSFYEAHGWTYERIAQLITVERFDVVAIDPLNLIPGFADQSIMTEAARRFQSVAKRANTHLIMVCHLNRKRTPSSAKEATVPRPQVMDIRDSGMIANNSDVTVGVFREQDEETGELTPNGEIYLAKVRNGFRTRVKVSLEPRRLKFELREEDEIDDGLFSGKPNLKIA